MTHTVCKSVMDEEAEVRVAIIQQFRESLSEEKRERFDELLLRTFVLQFPRIKLRQLLNDTRALL